jgi:hypothetical protein
VAETTLKVKSFSDVTSEGFADSAIKYGKSAGKYVARGAARVFSRETAKNIGGNIAASAAIEGGVVAADKLKKKKAKQQQQQVTEATIKMEPPVVLVLKRKTIRLYPHGEKIAIYRNDKLGVNFAVPFDDSDDGIKADTGPIHGGISEGISGNFIKQAKKLFKRKKKTLHQAQSEVERQRRAKENYDKLYPYVMSPFTAVGAQIAGAIAAGYAVDRAVDAARKHIERPSNRMHNGSRVYEATIVGKYAGATANLKKGLRLAGKGGIIAGTAMAAVDAIKLYRAKKKKDMKEKQISESVARRKGSKKTKPKVVGGLTPKGYKRGRAKGMAQNVIRKARKLSVGKAAAVGAVGGAVVGAAVGAGTNVFKDFMQKRKINEIAPIAAGIAARAAAIRLSAPTVAKAAVKNIGSNVAGGVAADTAVQKSKQLAAERKAKQEAAITPPSGSPVDESTQSKTGVAKAKAKFKKTWVPQGLGKEVVKGGAIALGSAVATKLIDMGYDRWRDKAEVKKETEIARATAKAKAEVAPKEVITKKRVDKKHGVVTIRKKVIEHANGERSEIPGNIVEALDNLYSQLNEENRALMESFIQESPAGLKKVTEFALKHRG